MSAKQLRKRKLEINVTTQEEYQFKRSANSRGMTLAAWARDAMRMQMIRDRALGVADATQAAK